MTVPEKEAGYQGWSNYESWAVALWIDNEQGSQEWAETVAFQCYEEATATEYSTRREEAIRCLADVLKNEVEEWAPDLGATLFADLLNAALSEVDWRELAQHYLTDEIVAEIDAEESEDEDREPELRPYPHPGKFEGGLVIDEAVYQLTLDGADDECGSVSEDGVNYQLLRAPISMEGTEEGKDLTEDECDYLRSLGGGAIVRENSDGFVDVAYYETPGAIDAAWTEIVASVDVDPDDADAAE